MSGAFALFACFALLAVGACEKCTNPKVTSKSFTTEDATIVTNIAFIADFSLECAAGAAGGLYAEIGGSLLPVSVVAPGQFQVSWTEDTKTARSGDKVVRLFDEDGFAAVKKAWRNEEDGAAVAPLAEVVVSHPGAYSGPWLKSELVATLVSLVVAYFAVTFKLKVSA